MERVEIRRTVLDLTKLQLSRGTKVRSGAEESELEIETREPPPSHDSWSSGQGRDDSASVCEVRGRLMTAIRSTHIRKKRKRSPRRNS